MKATLGLSVLLAALSGALSLSCYSCFYSGSGRDHDLARLKHRQQDTTVEPEEHSTRGGDSPYKAKDCYTNATKAPIRKCSGNDDVCSYSKRTEQRNNEFPKVTVRRGCDDSRDFGTTDECDSAEIFFHKIEACVCSTDKCNGARVALPERTAALAWLLAVVGLMRFPPNRFAR